MKLSIGIAQLELVDGDFRSNIEKGLKAIELLVSSGSKVVVLPELWVTGYGRENIRRFAENKELFNDVIKALRTLSGKYEALIIAPMPYKLGSYLYNSALVFRDGEVIARYDKIHLFSLYNEDKLFSKGNSLVIVNYGNVRIGVTICYDLRFPELYRILTLKGAEIIVVPASWGAPRKEQWRTLLRARALENQVILVGVNRVGSSNVIDERFAGNSCVIDPLGNEVACLGEHEEAINISVDLNWISRAREYLTLWRDRRTDLYTLRSKWGGD